MDRMRDEAVRNVVWGFCSWDPRATGLGLEKTGEMPRSLYAVRLVRIYGSLGCSGFRFGECEKVVKSAANFSSKEESLEFRCFQMMIEDGESEWNARSTQ